MSELKVCVIGTGYVGLVTGACFAELGYLVYCIDVDAAKIEQLENGSVPIYEAGLDELVARNREAGRLNFSTEVDDAIKAGCSVIFLAVGTPSSGADGGADLTDVMNAVDGTARSVAATGLDDGRYYIFVTKSTVPVGTSVQLHEAVSRHIPEDRFGVASNPEFLREGNAVHDFMAPDRIVIGSESERARSTLEELYRPLTRAGRPVVVTETVATAELIKYAANAFLATKVSFINELARLCERAGANVEELSLGVGLDRRIGSAFLRPGPGYGGSCFPKDTAALVKTATDFDCPIRIVETVIASNDRHKDEMVAKIRDALGGSLSGKRIAVLGLAFKADTDDMRDAPALTIVPGLAAEGADLIGHDPHAGRHIADYLPDLNVADSIEEALKGADAAVILTEWDDYRHLPWETFGVQMSQNLVIDLRNIYDQDSPALKSIDYVSLGRPHLTGG